MMLTTLKIACVAVPTALFGYAAAGAVPAHAATLQGSVSCVEGFVEPYDYAELSQDFAQSFWDTKGTLQLNSDSEQLTLQVLDINNASVCENLADLRTRCIWQLNAGSTYNVRIDNTSRPTQTGYKLCAS